MPIDSMIDLRSDTVTKPSAEMRAKIAAAEVGDAVIDVDPTVHKLEELTAELLGTEAAIYMPSGSMTNQIAIRLHCRPGDEFLCEADCHVYNYEQAAFAQLSGLVAHCIQGVHGVLEPQQLIGKIRPDNDHMVRTQLVCLENTHNRGGGKVQPQEKVKEICRWAAEHGLRKHLDGARLWNAAAATGRPVRELAAPFDSVSVCFSKGLGAPVGSALAGSRDFIRDAKRARKLFGGGMRQAGIIAAGALYALEHNRDRLLEDHEHAKLLATAIDASPHVQLVDGVPDTNIVLFDVDPAWGTAAQFVATMEEQGVRAMAVSPERVRLVTHLDVDRQQIDRACETIRSVAEAARSTSALRVEIG